MNQNRVSFSRCQKCCKVMNEADLKDYEEGIGSICVDETVCNERQEKPEAEGQSPIKSASLST